MRNRILIPIAVLILALAAAGTAAAATGVFEPNDSRLDSPRDIVERGAEVAQPITSLPDTTVPGADDNEADDRAETPVDLADGATQTFPAGDACSVTVHREGNVLSVVSVNTNSGFASEVEQGSGTEVEVKCDNGTTRVDFNAEIEDGAVHVEVRVRNDAPDAVQTTAPGVPPTTPTTEPEDNSGPASGHEDEADDDHSGSGSDGSGSDDSGSDHSGSDDSGSDNSGSDNSGSDNSGSGGGGSGPG